MFDKSTTNWKKQQRGGQNVIGRLPVVSILDIERYYLRMLLLRKSGAISFDDILTVNGLRCITFQQACQEYGLLRDLPASVLERVNFDVVEEQAKANSYTMQLNSEQRNVVEILLSAVYNNAADTPKCYFLDGPAGTGKTFFNSTLLHTIRGRGDDVIPVASTGIAATLLIRGRTAHSVFKIPIDLNATSTCNLMPNRKEADM
ncbi:hypothetical protein AVEN_116677-1 [Araneus ventricosus]|uniref:ATP-dependent DNA helicase n=1 Tax=Araneus ventricosus TaxID=182803 RepID=A0A4Y2L4C9_ARAVE|nr:hypothetical protein AVEN_116677-1 [Araneus ventricosus]